MADPRVVKALRIWLQLARPTRCVLFCYKYTLCFFRTGEPYKDFLVK